MSAKIVKRILLIVLFVLVGSLIYTNKKYIGYVFAHQGQAPTETPIRPFDDDIKFLQNEIEHTVDQDVREFLEQKLAIVARMATMQAATPKLRPTRPAIPHSITTTPIIQGKKITGIFYAPLGISSAVYKEKNAWQEKINGNYIMVAAGGLTKEQMQGMLFVQVNEGATHFWLSFKTPEKHGAVEIKSAKNYRLLLEAEDGWTIFFDVPSMIFTQSENEVLPTRTPGPPQSAIIETKSVPYP